MKYTLGICLGCIVFASLALPHFAQEAVAPDAPKPLVLTEAIPMTGVQGRFDHFGFDGKNRLIVAALGNNTVEIIDISARLRSHSIPGIPNPQGVVYAPESKKLFAASSKGKLYIYDGATFDLVKSIDFHGDVDNLRYDSTNQRVYVGYGEDETGAIGAVDASTNERLPEEYKLGAHPESFQLESSGPNIYVNLPDLKQIAVINRKTHAVTRWPMTLEHNFPMALDEADHRLFVATHEPPRLSVFDTNTGQSIAVLPCVQDADDVYYDAGRKRIYVPGGEGFISVFEQADKDHYSLLAKVPSTLGARTAGYFGKGKKGFDRFFLAVPARADHGAEIWIYTVQD
ncbi:MAG TPA: YncE family protein [Candidatus Acidoferrum sp.]|nr:YncE family protein [Candidatus Acidoferrum sp.]